MRLKQLWITSLGQDISRVMVWSRTSPQVLAFVKEDCEARCNPSDADQNPSGVISVHQAQSRSAHARGCDEDSAQLIPLARKTICIR